MEDKSEKVDTKVRFITSTKKGDGGQTRLLSGEKVSKSDLRIEAGGNLDEFNAVLGLSRSLTKNEKLSSIILNLQNELFLLGAELSSTDPDRLASRIEQENIAKLENWINELQEEAPLSPRFVSLGANPVSAALNVARTVLRRTERSMVTMQETALLERGETLRYVNRLGTLIYIMARYAEKVE